MKTVNAWTKIVRLSMDVSGARGWSQASLSLVKMRITLDDGWEEEGRSEELRIALYRTNSDSEIAGLESITQRTWLLRHDVAMPAPRQELYPTNAKH